MSKAIGIDLGTTNSCVSVVEGGVPVIISSSDGLRTTPSIVAFSKEGERLVGQAAQRQAAVNAGRTISSIKRYMGTDWSIPIDGKTYNPQEISAMILRKLKADAEDYVGETVTDVVITVPAYFNDIQRQATKDAGRIAGLNVLRIINEPTSASLAYGLNNGAAQKIMVYDLGGGTFDVSIIEMGDDIIEVLATAGDNHLGGDDFDQRIVDWMVQEYRNEYRGDVTKDITAMRRIREAAEQAKKDLSLSASATISLPYLTQNGSDVVHLELQLTRTKFNELTRDLVERTAGPVQTALNDAGIAPSELGKVLLVGGSTRIPAVQEKVRMLTGMEPSKNINPDECVAQGAAIQADILSSGGNGLISAGNSILLLDVTPLSLSIETVGGVANRLVERNSTLPVHYSKIFSTAAPYQTNVEIHVLQGERPMAKDNKTIGRFKLKGIKRAPAGVPKIEVTFDIDANGILKVSAKDLDTGKEQSITISANDKMSEDEIQKAMYDAQIYAEQDGIRTEALEVIREGQKLAVIVERSLKTAAKQIEKSEKKRVKSELSDFSKLLSKTKVDRITEADVMRLQDAMIKLKASSANVCALAGESI